MKRLDLTTDLKTKYCIPTWLRDEQIKLALKKVQGRIQPVHEPRTDAIAVVGFGPSLNDTWDEIRTFKYIVTCSGAHKFLVDRGIIPTWHVEVDPREHKVHLIGQPQRGTEYLIASTCHPKVFDHLDGHNVKLWHVFDNSEEGKRLLPAGEWAVTGGCDAGLRAVTIAAFLGFRELHVFGLDGSARDGKKHADEHPNKVSEFAEVEYPEGSGIMYHTTSGMLEAAKQMWHELDQLPKVKATFYGGGLIQAMSVNYKPKPAQVENIVAFAKPEVISAEYRALNIRLHRENLGYGVGGGRHAKTVIDIMNATKARGVLDYGCGKGYLGKELARHGVPIWEYDPCVEGKQETPRPADLVVCADVLEHVEPDYLLNTLSDLSRCVKQVGYFVINTTKSTKTLADGRNAHLIQQGQEWWKKKLADFFHIGSCIEKGHDLHFVVGPKREEKKAA